MNSQPEKPQFVIIPSTSAKVPYSHTKVIWVALALACFLLFGDAYAFDNPMALQSTIQEEMDLTNLQFNMLYSIYSLPNIILPFFGGMLIDKIGVRVSIFIFSSILILGQGIVVIGGYALSYYTMLIGRGIFGMGSESLNAAQASIMSVWFAGKQVSLALGLCLSFPKLGSAMNSFISPIINGETSLGFTLFVGLLIVIFSWVCGIGLIFLDKENAKRLAIYKSLGIKTEEEQPKEEISMIERKKSKDSADSLSQDDEYLKSPFLNSEDSYQLEHDSPEIRRTESITQDYEHDHDNDHDHDHEHHLVQRNESHEEVKEEIKLSDIKELDGSYWILAIIVMLSEALFVPFLDNGNDFLQVKYGFSQKSAGALLTIPYILSACLTPFIGIAVDKFGNRSLLIIMTSSIFIITHLLLLLINCETACAVSALPLFSLGLCYTLYSAILIPSIPMLVNPRMIGTAFGLVGVFQNTALALFPLITGHLFNSHLLNDQGEEDPRQGYFIGSFDKFFSYTYQSFFFVGMSMLNLLIAIGLYVFDRHGSHKLNRKIKKQK